jgi:WD40 repeat protein
LVTLHSPPGRGGDARFYYTMPILFLSHSGSDTEAARALKRRIEDSPAAREAGLKVWFDKDDLRAGKSWQQQLAATIEKEADAFAVLLGARGVVNWIEAEVEVALSRATTSSFPFIPIIARESQGSNALPAFARRFQGVLDPLNDSDQLAKLIKAATGNWDQKVILTDEPFVGLRAMDESWANRFFGRKTEVRELVEKFKKHRLIAIVADSGAGKSSLAQAGLIPAFRGGALADESREEPDDKIWHVVIMRPGSDPIQGLKDGITDAARLFGLDGDKQAKLRGRLNISDPGESAYALRCDLDRRQTETLLIIDQFEELLIQTPEEKRVPFVDFLCALADGPFGFRILLTLRADYFNLDDSLKQLRSRLWADGQDAVFRLRRMSDQALAETAREPLALAGFRDQAAVDALIQAIQRDVSDREGDLALVQMALHSVWRRHKTQSEDLLQAYAEVQGVSGALAHEAEKVRGKLNDAQKALLFPILARLIRRGELGGATRRIAQRNEFDSEKQRLIAHLSSEEGGRLLVAGDASVEIAHEALITRWPWLRTEGQKLASDIEELSRLIEKTKAWAKEPLAKRSKYLATGAELETFSALAERHKDWLSSTEREFVAASEQEKQQQQHAANRLRWLVTALVAAFVALLGVATLLKSQAAQQATEQRDALLLLQSRFLADLANQHTREGDAGTGMLLALEALPDIDGGIERPLAQEAEAALYTAYQELRESIVLAHEKTVYSATFAPDGLRLVTASEDNTARLWDAENGDGLAVLDEHKGSVRVAAFSPDGRDLITASTDHTARLWEVETGKRSFVLEHDAAVRSATFSPDGGRVVTASDNTARIWDVRTGKQITILQGHGGIVWSAAFSPDGRRVVTASDDATARLWDTGTGELVRVLEGHTKSVRGATFSPDGKRIVTAGTDNTARVWDAETGKTIAVLGHIRSVWSAAFSPDGRRVVTASDDNTARIWNVLTGQNTAVLEHGGPVKSATFSPDGLRVVTASDDTMVRIWDTDRGERATVLGGHSAPVRSVEFSRDGARILTASSDDTARLWSARIETGKPIAILRGHNGPVQSIAFSPDGRRVITASADSTVRLWDSGTGKLVRVLEGHTKSVRSAAFSPDGKRIVTAGTDNTARVWDAETGKTIAVLEGHTRSVWSAAFSPDGERIVTASDDGTARVWDADASKTTAVLDGHTEPVWSASFSPDGGRIATASDDKTARIWRVFPTPQALVDRSKAVVPRCLAPAERAKAFLGTKPPAWCRTKWPIQGSP